MGEIVKREKLLGKMYTVVGDGSSDIILNCIGKVKVRFGNAFLDLVSNGTIESLSKASTVISKVKTKTEIGDKDGWYFTLDTRILYYKIDEILYNIASQEDGGETTDTYLSFTNEQNLSMSQILLAQRNIVNIIDSYTDINELPENLAYFDVEKGGHYIKEGTTLKELYLNITLGGIISGTTTVNLKSKLHGPKDFNIIGDKGLDISNSSNNMYITPGDVSVIGCSSRDLNIVTGRLNPAIYIEGASIGIGSKPNTLYGTTIGNSLYSNNSVIFDNGLSSDIFASGLSGRGYSMYLDNTLKWTLEVDNLIVRNNLLSNSTLGGGNSKGLLLDGLNKNIYFSAKGSIIETIADETTGAVSSISVTGLYDVRMGDILEYSTYEVQYTTVTEGESQYTSAQPTKIRKGEITITSITWMNIEEDAEGVPHAVIEGTYANNVIGEAPTYPIIGDTVTKKSGTVSMYINSLENKYIQAVGTSVVGEDTIYSTSRIGSLGGLKNPLNKNILSDLTVGVYSDLLYVNDIKATQITTRTNVTDNSFTDSLYITDRLLTLGTTEQAEYENVGYGFRIAKTGNTNRYFLVNGSAGEWRSGLFTYGSVPDYKSYPLALRDETNTFTNEHLIIWDSAMKVLKDSGFSLADLSQSNITITSQPGSSNNKSLTIKIGSLQFKFIVGAGIGPGTEDFFEAFDTKCIGVLVTNSLSSSSEDNIGGRAYNITTTKFECNLSVYSYLAFGY